MIVTVRIINGGARKITLMRYMREGLKTFYEYVMMFEAF